MYIHMKTNMSTRIITPDDRVDILIFNVCVRRITISLQEGLLGSFVKSTSSWWIVVIVTLNTLESCRCRHTRRRCPSRNLLQGKWGIITVYKTLPRVSFKVTQNHIIHVRIIYLILVYFDSSFFSPLNDLHIKNFYCRLYHVERPEGLLKIREIVLL